MKYMITDGERVVISALIADITGVNRTDGRLITKISDHLALVEVQTGVKLDKLDNEVEYDLAELETLWILDHINKMFDASKMLPHLAKYALQMEDKLKKEDGEVNS